MKSYCSLVVLLVVLAFAGSNAYAQHQPIDSILKALEADSSLIDQYSAQYSLPPSSERTVDGLKELALANMTLSAFYLNTFDSDEHIRLLDVAIDALYGSNEKHLLTRALRMRGHRDLYRHNVANAILYFEEALDLASRTRDSAELFLLHKNIGFAYLYLEDEASAVEPLTRALEFDKEHELQQTLLVLHVLAESYCLMGDVAHGETYIRKMEDFVERTGVEDRMGRLGMANGEYHLARGDADQAISYLKVSLDRAIASGEPTNPPYLMSRIATAHQNAGRFNEAVKWGQKGLRWCEERGLPKELQDNHYVLYLAYSELKDPRGALDNLEGYLELKNSRGSVRVSGLLNSTVARTEHRQKLYQDSLLRAEEEKLQLLAHEAEVQRQKNTRNIALFTGLGILALAFGLWSRLRFTRRAKAAIEKEKEVSEGLLLNILPAEVAAELKEKGEADARSFDETTVLFTDFKGFTSLSEKLSPAELVKEINVCFKVFDGIMEDYGIEKIKTIGDAYMAAGGLHTPRTAEAKDMVLAGLEMQAFIQARKAERDAAGLPAFEMRLGIHTGPVVAGIVGVKKFQYDIWGDTVNTASRMESSGTVGRVNISQSTYDRIKDDPQFALESRGKVQAKGKGELEMWFVEKRT